MKKLSRNCLFSFHSVRCLKYFDLYGEITQLSPLACFNHTVRTNFFCNFRESNIFFSPYRLKDSKNQ